ncbi:MAG: polysaccharide deacetylase family protein [Elusimicrobia bacterium]|nr:polysaccharide deacetylase family protein [Elusimicrobiota bacterium]
MSDFKKTVLAVLAAVSLLSASVYPANGKTVILTFDDGPHPITTEKILEILKQHDVPATFFLVGKMIKRHPYLARKIYESDYEIGNHTYSDTRLTAMSGSEIRGAMTSVNDLLFDITGKRTCYFRPPGGRLDENVREIACEQGYSVVLWTRFVNDTAEKVSCEDIVRRATSGPRDKEIIMMHDGPEKTIQALPEVIRFYKDRGYSFSTVSRICPPMFEGASRVAKNSIEEWPVYLWDAGSPIPVSRPSDLTKKLTGFMVVFASVGSTVFFVRVSNGRKGPSPISLVFLGAGQENFLDICRAMSGIGLKGTFFVSEEDARRLPGAGNLTDGHDMAYMKDGCAGDLAVGLKRWKDALAGSGYTYIPLCYSPSGFDEFEIKFLRGEGFLPVDWKLPPPPRYILDKGTVMKGYFLRRLKAQKVIPLWGDAAYGEGVIEELVKSISEKGYSFMPLEEYVVKKHLN